MRPGPRSPDTLVNRATVLHERLTRQALMQFARVHERHRDDLWAMAFKVADSADRSSGFGVGCSISSALVQFD